MYQEQYRQSEATVDEQRVKIKELHAKLELAITECEDYKRQVVSIEELKRNRDERIERLNKEYESKCRQLETTEQEFAESRTTIATLTDQLAQTQIESNEFQAHLGKATEVRAQQVETIE